MSADPFQNIPNADDSENGEFSPAKVTRPTRAYDITDRADRALMILVEAHDAGLPMPGYVTIGAHDHGEFRSSDIKFQLADDGEVGAWARYFGSPFVSEKHGSSVTLEKSGQHDVQAYHYDRSEEAAVPGLAEHTQAAPDVVHRMTIGMGNHCGAPTGPGNGRATTFAANVTCPACIEIRPSADLSGQLVPEGKAGTQVHLGLAESTQAACDTITKASQ